MYSFAQIFKMDLSNNSKNIVLIGFNTIFFLLIVLIFGFLSEGAYADPIASYNYYGISILVYSIFNGAMTATNSFMERDIKRPNLRIIHSPVGKSAIYFSKILSSFVFNYICHLLVVLLLMFTMNLNFGGQYFGYVLLLMVPLEFATSALGIFFCCLFKTEEIASTLLSNVLSILAFLGGVFFSLESMGPSIAWVSKLSPIKWITDAFFMVIFDSNFNLFWPVFGISILISAVLVYGCEKCFRTEDYLC
ncbi:ABC transporter permease [Paenibacillus turicensis]|uniref:ABC transporter permease n=1 Tax=Paenibacillus turicensis TaxID=160487 RepID=UPI003D29C80F